MRLGLLVLYVCFFYVCMLRLWNGSRILERDSSAISRYFPLDSFKFVLKAFPCHEILVPAFKFFQIVHGSLFYNLPISLLSASYTFQQAKLLKAGKVVLYAVLRNVRKTFTYLLSGCFRMFFYE